MELIIVSFPLIFKLIIEKNSGEFYRWMNISAYMYAGKRLSMTK